MHPIGLDAITLRIDLHLGRFVIELHVLLADVATVLDGLDAFHEVVGFDYAVGDGGGGDEGYGRGGHVGCEHRAHYYRLDRWD